MEPDEHDEPADLENHAKKEESSKSTDKQGESSKTADKQAEKKATSAKVKEAELINQMRTLLQREDVQKPHAFWATQPVPQTQLAKELFGPIDAPKDPARDIQSVPYKLPDSFEWAEFDIDDDSQMQEIYTLLNENYVEDDDAMFRFDYSVPFLRWALKPPGWRKDWHVTVRATSNKKILAVITAAPAEIRVYDQVQKMVEINFLCVHKKLRSKRLAPVLIKEITRRVNLTGIFQAIYTAGVVIPTPVSRCRYYHRSLNPKKLIDVGFSRLGPRMTMQRTIKLYALPDKPSTPGLRELRESDVRQLQPLLNKYLEKFNLAPVFTVEEVLHNFIPRPGVIFSYVVEDPKTKELTDFISFYELCSSILGNAKFHTLRAAYAFYNVPATVPYLTLMRDALVLAKQKDFDVFNALDIMENETVFKDLKFGMGDGNLQYYLYNWRCPEIPPKGVGIVLT